LRSVIVFSPSAGAASFALLTRGSSAAATAAYDLHVADALQARQLLEKFPSLRISVLRGHDDQFEAPRLSGGLQCALKVRERKHVRPHRRVPHRTQPMFGVATLR
jgi:hypothetical protein